MSEFNINLNTCNLKNRQDSFVEQRLCRSMTAVRVDNDLISLPPSNSILDIIQQKKQYHHLNLQPHLVFQWTFCSSDDPDPEPFGLSTTTSDNLHLVQSLLWCLSKYLFAYRISIFSTLCSLNLCADYYKLIYTLASSWENVQNELLWFVTVNSNNIIQWNSTASNQQWRIQNTYFQSAQDNVNPSNVSCF